MLRSTPSRLVARLSPVLPASASLSSSLACSPSCFASTSAVTLPVAGRAFSTSLARPESDFKRDRRMYRKKVDMLHKQAQEDWYNTQPDPFLGMQLVYADGVPVHEQRWRQTKLSATILDSHTLWTTGPNAPKNVFSSLSMFADEDVADSSTPADASETTSTPRKSKKILARPMTLAEKLQHCATDAERDLVREEHEIEREEHELGERVTEKLQERKRLALTRRKEVLKEAVFEAARRSCSFLEEEINLENPRIRDEFERVMAVALPVQETTVADIEAKSNKKPTTGGAWSDRLSNKQPTPAPAIEDTTRPIVDSDHIEPPSLVEEPSTDYGRAPRVTLFSTDNPIDSFRPPPFINFLLKEPEKRFFFNTLPHVSAQRDVLLPPPGVKLTKEDMDRRIALAEVRAKEEVGSMEAFGRILSLRNASAKQIARENRRRIVDAFGEPEVKSLKSDVAKPRKGPDTGSQEVQAALLTLKIRNLRAHLMRNMHDTINTSIIKKLAQRRRKILLYLKRIDRVRFDKCLQEIGVDQRAIEGEIAVHRFWRQVPAPVGTKAAKDTKFVGKVGKVKARSTMKNLRKINPIMMGGQGKVAYY